MFKFNNKNENLPRSFFEIFKSSSFHWEILKFQKSELSKFSFLLLTLNILTPFSIVSIFDFEQVNVSWVTTLLNFRRFPEKLHF